MTGSNNISRPGRHSLVRTGLALAAIVCSAFFATSPVWAASAFEKELKAQNAHHLAKQLNLPKTNKPPAIERDYDDKLKRDSWQLSEGPISISVTLTKGGPPDGMLFKLPVLSLSVEGKKILSVEGSESFPDNPVFTVQIAELDPGNPYKEVVFSTFSGGAHCCSDTRILTSSKDGKRWITVEMDPIDGEPLEARDLDGDGLYEFAFPDNSFFYAFGCYACSAAPLHVLRLRDAMLTDVSGEPPFRPHQVKSLQNLIEWAGDGMDMNGFLAGYVAQKILLGESAQAWKLMLKYHDRKGDWGLNICKVKENDKGECPPGKQETLSYPDALERFYRKTGYKLKK